MWIPTSTLAHTTELLYDGLDLGARHHACRREREVGATLDRDPAPGSHDRPRRGTDGKAAGFLKSGW